VKARAPGRWPTRAPDPKQRGEKGARGKKSEVTGNNDVGKLHVKKHEFFDGIGIANFWPGPGTPSGYLS
jgi:hypothetical protein